MIKNASFLSLIGVDTAEIWPSEIGILSVSGVNILGAEGRGPALPAPLLNGSEGPTTGIGGRGTPFAAPPYSFLQRSNEMLLLLLDSTRLDIRIKSQKT